MDQEANAETTLAEKWLVEDADAAELGVRPFGWEDATLYLGGKERSAELTVGASTDFEYDFNEEDNISKKKQKVHGEDACLSDDDEYDYERDPETGEKIFRDPAAADTLRAPSTTTNSPTWILQEYLSNFDTNSSKQLLSPATIAGTTASVNAELPSTFLSATVDEEQDHLPNSTSWFNELLLLDRSPTSEALLTVDPFLLLPRPTLLTTVDDSLGIEAVADAGSVDMISTPLLLPLETETLSLSVSSNDGFLPLKQEDRRFRSFDSDSTTRDSMTESNSNDTIMVHTKIEKMEPDDDSSSSNSPSGTRHGSRRSSRSQHGVQADEELLRMHHIPITLDQITQTSTDDYNRLLVRLTSLSAEQMHIIKDIRRRGKNKVAAQNCRKRKAVNVESLAEEVDELKRLKSELEEQKRIFQQQIAETRSNYEFLHRQVLPERPLPPTILVK